NRANGGRSRGASACALLKKDAKSNPESEPMSGDFNPEQKRYLEGFVAGLQIAQAARAGGGGRGAAAGGPARGDAPPPRAPARALAAAPKALRLRNRPAPTPRTCARRIVFSEPAASSPSRKNSSASSTRSTATSG